jgi:hypothetical protein
MVDSPPAGSVSVSDITQVSQITTTITSVIGGRNKQAQNRQNRRIAVVTSTQRRVQAMTRSDWTDPPVNTSAHNECGTNANTCCLGKNFVVLNATYRTADVYAYDSLIKPIKNVPIVTGATAYDDPMGNGNTPDTSEYLDFEFYDRVLFRTNAGLGKVQLGRWLGVSHRVGCMMSFWLLPPSSIPVSVTTVQRLTNVERATDEMRSWMQLYDDKLKSLFNAHQSANVSHALRNVDSDKIIDPEDEDPRFYDEFMRMIDNAQLPHADDERDVEVESDNYIGIEFTMAQGGDGEQIHAQVRRRLTDKEGLPGKAHTNHYSI